VVVPAAAPNTVVWLGSICLFGILALVLPVASAEDRPRRFAVYLCSLVVSGSLLMLFAWHVNAAIDPMRRVLTLLTDGGEGPREAVTGPFALFCSGPSLTDLGYHLITVAAAAAIPLMAAAAFWFISRIHGVPLSVALVRGFRGCAVPIACTLLLVYAALLPITLATERFVDSGVRQSLQHEGRYLAGLSHKTWPGEPP